MNVYNHSNVSKFIRDFKSQVMCLPGPVKNSEVKETGKLMSEKRQEKTDIFFSKKTENIPEKKTFKFLNVKKNMESREVEVVRRRSSRPDNIKNEFESQIFK